eukprot:CAMPEP_0185732292 /NCGR_PEP_ID=MMETSP1171-20130828/15663_1 /TAXON_ID=374046 /ORGANISM="Helicotheca tamensis, Strain CCMP826" /LENGTH=124 /DNA_ID=CAMNT_0028401739 /DNA_START=51 /DNA_END=422 /DNA_ORIENTATION=+
MHTNNEIQIQLCNEQLRFKQENNKEQSYDEWICTLLDTDNDDAGTSTTLSDEELDEIMRSLDEEDDSSGADIPPFDYEMTAKSDEYSMNKLGCDMEKSANDEHVLSVVELDLIDEAASALKHRW